MTNNRRSFLTKSSSLLALMMLPRYSQAQESCLITAAQTQGPFYPGEKKIANLIDLTVNEKNGARAAGQVVYITGTVRDEKCQPIPSAVVEIWQACETGKYDHDHDPNTAEKDPNFKYAARAITDANGQYNFKTIIPGAYPADEGWMRPPHIHYHISALGYKELVTQMYFDGNALNEKDYILLETPENQRKDLVVKFAPSAQGLQRGSLTGTFDITLRKMKR